ncbi:MAG: hypothetical protein IJV35_11010 [Neisseriaceae bacterium]|nr:hypothetical protein [Neisseriaceae bacterium]
MAESPYGKGIIINVFKRLCFFRLPESFRLKPLQNWHLWQISSLCVARNLA